MKCLVSGSTGLIGSALVRELETNGHDVRRLLRPSSRFSGAGTVWDPARGIVDPGTLEGFDAVVHLAGENVADRRWSDAQKRRIRDSRVGPTALLAETLATLDRPPSVLMCASAGGYYGDRGDEELEEGSAPGTGFLAETTRDWELAGEAASAAGIRVVNLRISVVQSAAGGMLKRVLPIFRLGLGGTLGSGKQYMSWVTRSDVIAATVWALERSDIVGPVNVTSPNPITNSEFTRALARAVRRPALFAVPKFALRIAQGDLSEVVVSSLRMRPTRLVASGFSFAHPDIDDALGWALGDTAF